LLITLMSSIAGCANRGGFLGVDYCADVPAGAVPEIAGTKVCNWQTEQIAGAIADQAVLYQADFLGSSDQLSPAALDRISRHAQSNLANVLPWVIEPSGDSTLDTARVASTINALSVRGVPPTDVQIATPAALGLTGPQAERVARGFGSVRNSSAGTGAPLTRPAAFGGFGGGLSSGYGGLR
jgi:hypothetical protein